MSFDSQLIHSLVIERATEGVAAPGTPEADYNQPTETYAALATIKGLIQPKTAREVAQFNQAGAVVSTHTVYLRPTDLKAADRIRFDPDDGRRFEIDGIRDAAGRGHHLQADARLVEA